MLSSSASSRRLIWARAKAASCCSAVTWTEVVERSIFFWVRASFCFRSAISDSWRRRRASSLAMRSRTAAHWPSVALALASSAASWRGSASIWPRRRFASMSCDCRTTSLARSGCMEFPPDCNCPRQTRGRARYGRRRSSSLARAGVAFSGGRADGTGGGGQARSASGAPGQRRRSCQGFQHYLLFRQQLVTILTTFYGCQQSKLKIGNL